MQEMPIISLLRGLIELFGQPDGVFLVCSDQVTWAIPGLRFIEALCLGFVVSQLLDVEVHFLPQIAQKTELEPFQESHSELDSRLIIVIQSPRGYPEKSCVKNAAFMENKGGIFVCFVHARYVSSSHCEWLWRSDEERKKGRNKGVMV
jgi:hypothetical protein